MRVTQSQNVPLSCLSRPLADRLAEAAYRDILGLSYARAFPQLGVLLTVDHHDLINQNDKFYTLYFRTYCSFYFILWYKIYTYTSRDL